MADADTLRGAGVPGPQPGSTASQPAAPPPVPIDPGAPSRGAAGDESVMSLVGHLTELRSRIVRSALAVAAGSVLGFVASERAIAILRAPIPTTSPLYFTGLGDAFVIRMKIAIVIGVILAMPVILYQIWSFVAPGLTVQERRVVRPWLPLALAFFALGVVIAYIILPFAAQFLLSFTTPDFQPLITAGAYFDFVTTLFLAFGLVMEFPILLYGLSRVGILTSQRLRSSRRMVILGISIFAAVVTPGGDLVSPFVLGVTMYILFEATVIAIRRSGR
jgi:sec-independent protein translocase protein TatC